MPYRRLIATVEILCVFPAALFMLALFLRNVQPEPYEPAQSARHLVDWFAVRPHIGLQLLLIGLPFAALVIGVITMLRIWRTDREVREITAGVLASFRAHASIILITAATLLAGTILSIVALHVITD